jgi:hypothetical protein
MMSTQPTNPDLIRESVLDTLSDEVACSALDDGSERVGCLTPFEYPDGDAVVVWVREFAGTFEVSDHGEGTSNQEYRSDHERTTVRRLVERTARAHGVRASGGRLGAECSHEGLGESVLRVASASAEVAAGIACQAPTKRKESEENEFVRLVDQTLRDSHVAVEREHKIDGSSGHPHKATIYVPDSHSVLEPVWGNWNQVASVYTKFSDLAPVNGFKRFSLLDDRSQKPSDDVRSLLVQVSSVVSWSRHDQWLSQIR